MDNAKKIDLAPRKSMMQESRGDRIFHAIMIALTVLLFGKGHPVWGVIFGLISVDFLADAVLSFKKA